MEDRRQYDRRQLEDLAARLSKKENEEDVDFCAVNVSEKGLAILTSQPLLVGSLLILHLSESNVDLKVVWTKNSQDGSGFYRSGLTCLEDHIHLDLLIKEELSI